MSTVIPNSWSMQYGVWDTDAERVTSPAPILGASCVRMNGSGGAVAMISDELVAVSPGSPFRVAGFTRATSKTAGNKPYLATAWYDSALAYLSTTYTSHEVSAVNTWEEFVGHHTVPAGARHARLIFGRDPGDGTYTCYWNSAEATPLPRCAKVVRQNSVLLAASPAAVGFDTTVYDYGGFWDAANNQFVAPAAMVVDVKLAVGVQSSGTFTWAVPRIAHNGNTIFGPYFAPVGLVQYTQASFQLLLARGDTIQASVAYSGAGNWTALGAAGSIHQTYMTLTEVKA